MNDIRLISVVDYLRLSKSNVHEEHLTKIRDIYRSVLHLSADTPVPQNPNEEAIKEVARQLGLSTDTDEDREYLDECVRYQDISDSITVVITKLAGDVKPIDDFIFEPVHPPASSSLPSLLPPQARPTPYLGQYAPHVAQEPIAITDIDCLLTFKILNDEIQQFIHSFLLQDIKLLHRRTITESIARCIRFGEQFYLEKNCLINLFIRQKLHDRDILTSSSNHRNSDCFRLIESVSLTDDFGTWQYDHWRDVLDLKLSPHGTNTRFPARWKLADDARIHCLITNDDFTRTESSSSYNTRPRTASLNVFVHDVCMHENNGQEDIWLRDLYKEDIRTFEHLANLRQSEWDNIRALSMNARKTLKAAVDRIRETMADERYQHISYDSDQDDDNDMIDNSTGSELLANLHLIKLFMCYTLREKRALRQLGILSKLEANCLDKVFDEMRKEGFADDGLFDKMAEFFLPLTISEQELCIERGLDTQKRQTLKKNQEQLIIDINKKTNDIDEQKRIFWTYDDQINLLEKSLNDVRDNYFHKRLTMIPGRGDGQQQQEAQALQQLDRKWHQQEGELARKINETNKLKKDLGKVIEDLEIELDNSSARLKNIEIELAAAPKYVDKQLVKPARGLIMYGPPGTGKSEIMSKLAVKLGIVMVGPPLAAGELNRPLVGESERVLIALCQRCYRIPYAMCCISIDEIDSLAPKRDEDSSEGKVDKISVLLSLIEGIKDVPNLMILCATNRLHMMDEAFLRRMSGKFFVGRPSSNARITILKSIPDCALEPEILDHLSVATTNFSGAAVRALTRSITVKCIAERRTNRNYQVNYVEALEIVDRTAQQYQILFGSETLPRLLLRNLLSGSPFHIHRLTNNSIYTGRIVVDLYSSYVRIEVRKRRANPTNHHLSIIEHELHPTEINVQTLLERLTSYGKNRNVQLLQLVDLNLLASQGAYDEKKVFETLKDRFDECVAYTRSMIVYDLDALVGVNKSESDSSMGRSTSSSVVNQSIYTYVRARFRDCAIEYDQGKSKDKIERWAVVVIREPFLLRQFCTDVQFARTPKEEQELELERRKAEDQIKCMKCKDFYIENENKMGNCVHHDGFIYDNSAADLTKYTQSQAMMLLSKLESDLINDDERRDELERQKTKFKWICCDAVLVSGNIAGCKKGKHGFNVNDNDNPPQRQLDDTIVGDLTQATIQQWEEACSLNEEYNDKWLFLLQNRG
ncbi:unnamed protein product [Rotaria sp. Silwood2]|nr:unnamed protein product [Rotaria sp. Silwood2]CAF3122788.1 unnamed protein product [Rotaria sp. Silwood2]CAF3369637.1 unnamed protein product [Rotaria sp. Silwood2]CAF3459105.1 unnamed protein product [Rotaria sp. Silwood2]CAF4242003.1 unnamed protein product [Rotaria sp. Silwood2]